VPDVPGPLRDGQIDEFVQRGFTILAGGFPRSVATAVRADLGIRLGADLLDPASWTKPRLWLKEALTQPPFTDAITARFAAAVDQLAGAGRWEPLDYMGWWPVTFPGFADPPYGDDWHVEGGFRHHIWSPEQALLPLFCFSDIESGGGGTLLAAGSHAVVAEVLWEAEPDGLDPDDIWPVVSARLDQDGWEKIEVVAEAGDIVLAHPLMFHSSNPNHGSRPRVMAQPRFDMTEPKRTQGDGLFPVEVPLAHTQPPAHRP